MTLKLKYKFFLILLAAGMIIITGMFLFTRFSFEQGFFKYVDKRAMRQLQCLCWDLEDSYSKHGSWQFLKEAPEKWYKLRDDEFRNRRNKHSCNYMPHRMKGEKKYWKKNYSNHNRKHGPTLMRGRSGNNHRIILLDKDKNSIFGKKNETDEVRLLPVTFRNETVGWLGMIHSGVITEAEELRFFQKQSRTFLLIFIIMIIISVIVAVLTAYYLEEPVRVLTKGTKALTSGNYDFHIPVKSKDELGQLSQDFNTLAKTLDKNEKDRKQWVSDIAHELRTPLTLLSGELEAIQDKVRELTPETLKLLQGDIDHLIRLVNDLGELARTDQGTFSYKKENIDLIKTLRRSIERFDEIFTANGLIIEDRIAIDTKVNIFADPERMGQLFENIFQNTLNYTHSGGRMRLEIDSNRDTATINIQDSEPGVPEEAIPQLFDRLYRIEPSRNKKLGGTGLGLAICKNIVQAHNGNISASHSPIGGLCIKIEFPVNG